MEKISIIKTVLQIVLPFLKSKAAKKVGSDFSEAFNNEALLLWKKVKPLFIYEDKNVAEELEEKPDDEMVQNGFQYQFSKKLDEKPELKLEFEDFLKAIQSTEGKSIVNQTHYGSGDNIAGNKIIYKK